MSTGFMWCNIRNPPLIANENGNPGYIAGGYSSQYGAEIFIVGGLCISNLNIRCRYVIVHCADDLQNSENRGSYRAAPISLCFSGFFLHRLFHLNESVSAEKWWLPLQTCILLLNFSYSKSKKFEV